MKRTIVAALALLGTLASSPRLNAQQAPTPATTPAMGAAATPTSNGRRSLTLPEAESLAIKNNPQITVGKLQALESHEFVREVRSAMLPQANLSVTAVDSDPGTRISAGYLTNPTVYPRAAAGATVSQLITDFGRTQNLVSGSVICRQSARRKRHRHATANRAGGGRSVLQHAGDESIAPGCEGNGKGPAGSGGSNPGAYERKVAIGHRFKLQQGGSGAGKTPAAGIPEQL